MEKERMFQMLLIHANYLDEDFQLVQGDIEIQEGRILRVGKDLPRREEEEDPRLELAGQLLEYQQCQRVAKELGRRGNFDSLVRAPEKLSPDLTYRRRHDPRELAQALAAAWGKGKSLLPPKPESFSALVTKKIVSVASQVVFVLRQLWKGKRVRFQALFAGKHDRSERVAAFLAVLELVKDKRIRIEGQGDEEEVFLLERGK